MLFYHAIAKSKYLHCDGRLAKKDYVSINKSDGFLLNKNRCTAGTSIMIVEIKDNLSIQDIWDAFHDAFPFLDIEFFNSGHDWGKASSVPQKIPHDKTISELRTAQPPGFIEIHGSQHTGAVEQEFGKIFGLHVQVFRRDGADWVQTVETDSRSLDEQNEAGRNASQELMDGTDPSFNRENPANKNHSHE